MSSRALLSSAASQSPSRPFFCAFDQGNPYSHTFGGGTRCILHTGRPRVEIHIGEKKATKPIKIDQTQATRVEAHFDGEVHLQRLVSAEEGSEVEVLAVFFSPGARNRPHTHEHDQLLQVLFGTAVVATETERSLLSSGELIRIPAHTWHWHGATPEAAMCHLAIQRPGFINWEVEERDWATTW